MGVTEILAGGLRLVRAQPRALAIWTLLYLVVIVAVMALVWPSLGDIAALQQQALAAQAGQLAPPEPPAGVAGLFGAIFLLDLVMLVLIVMIFAAAVRAVALGGDDRFGFLRLGMDEARLIGLGILLWLIGVGAGIVAMVAVALLGALAMLVGGQGAMIVALVLGYVALVVLLVWAEVRISLAGVYTVLRGRIVVREAWRATRGRFWTLFVAWLLIGLAFTTAAMLVIAIGHPQLFGLYGAMLKGASPEALVAYQRQWAADALGARTIVTAVLGAVVNVPLFAILSGALATAVVGIDRERADG